MRCNQFQILIFFTLIGISVAPSHIHADNIIVHTIQHIKEYSVGKASWYSQTDPGINIHTANMEIFDDSGLTAAMWDVPFNQLVKVTNLDNGKSVIVRINDRGPHRRFVRRGRLIDLSKEAFRSIARLEKGLISIQLELL